MKKQYGNSARFRLLKWLHPVLMAAVFLGCWYAYYVPQYQLNMASSIQVLLVAGYLIALLGLQKTYHALTVGLVRVTDLVYSQTLTNVISAALFYLSETLLCNQVLQIFPMIFVLLVQFALSALWSLAANKIYFLQYPAPQTTIVYRSEADLLRIESIRYFSEHFDVRKCVKDPFDDWDIEKELDDCQAVFVAGIDERLRNRIAKYCVEKDKKGYFAPHLGDIIMAGATYMFMFNEPIVKVQRAQTKTEYLALKRMLDVVISLFGLVVASPVMLATALAIKINDGGPVFYKQKRLTQNCRVFSILKFRSMKVNAEADGVARLASEHDSRITPVGKFIRATRIDELPQLINILRGDMSLVGPRPERPEIAAEYEKELPAFSLRLQVKAGLTGMAQVYGRYNTEPYSKLQMDLMYINELSLMTDIKLLFSTIRILFIKESTAGIEDGQKTALGGNDKTNRKTSA